MENSIIYLDNNATTTVDDRVIKIITSYFSDLYGNASSLYSFGNKAKIAIDKAKVESAKLIGAEPNEIYFTSGATEGINFALKGLAMHPVNRKKHIITCRTEHKAVLETCHYLESIGYKIDYLPVDAEGNIDLEALQKLISNDTLLVCLMWVNNETGVIYPIEKIGEITKAADVYFICDGTQGVGKLPININECNIDVLCFSGHKMYGPKGIGGIYINQSITRQNKIQPLIHGGGQEDGLRSGTYNVPLIAGLGNACEIAFEEMEKNRTHIEHLQIFLEKELLQIKGAFINGNRVSRIYNTINIYIPGFDSEIFIGVNKDIAVSNGSACTSELIQPSHVLLAMGLNNNDAMNSLRISIGKHNTKEDIQLLIQRIKDFINNY
ncbi:cysteine desulfurase family protein [Flavobacterium humi]|uniref:cysteine desulfurase n=1 Tax=Flavobacterium humi TaxID=2562683 RepID=A0A4Z0LA68_9FLAO|nr:cysteine desulfurase family protein [Flavobacterium humi]TGD58990.1 cysteine desulfurase [Flavobacterium humi]